MTASVAPSVLDGPHPAQPVCAMPPPAPLAMPEQDLAAPPALAFGFAGGADGRRRLARLVVFGGAAALAVGAGFEMRALMSSANHWLAVAFVALFAMAFAWTALAATSAAVGLCLGPRGRGARGAAPPIRGPRPS